jgi:hypothetical protein
LFRHRSLAIFFLPAFALISSLSLTQASQTSSTAGVSNPTVANNKDVNDQKDVSGKWHVAWTGRLGTEQAKLELQQDAGKLKGTFEDQRGISSLSGTIEGKNISFDVEFKGPYPFTTRFTGTIDADKISGTSQAVGVGGSGAYLGHAGEIVQPQHPWTAKRATNEPKPSADTKTETKPASNLPAKN